MSFVLPPPIYGMSLFNPLRHGRTTVLLDGRKVRPRALG
jgi:hypothetical protein